MVDRSSDESDIPIGETVAKNITSNMKRKVGGVGAESGGESSPVIPATDPPSSSYTLPYVRTRRGRVSKPVERLRDFVQTFVCPRISLDTPAANHVSGKPRSAEIVLLEERKTKRFHHYCGTQRWKTYL